MDRSQDIKDFYSDLQFPGHYTAGQLANYGPVPDNPYLSFIHEYLDHDLDILDAGCGTGLITNVFATRFRSQFWAVDFADSIDFGQRYAEANGIDNTHWIKSDLSTWNTLARFDRVICQGVLHHIPDYTNVLAKLKTWLRPGGILLLGLYNPYGKILKRFVDLDYGNKILEKDQERHPFEMSFTVGEALDLCHDMEFLKASHWVYNKYFTDLSSMFNSRNGGLITYAFRRV